MCTVDVLATSKDVAIKGLDFAGTSADNDGSVDIGLIEDNGIRHTVRDQKLTEQGKTENTAIDLCSSDEDGGLSSE